MTINHATEIIMQLIDESIGQKKANYVSLQKIIAEGSFFSEASQKIIRKINFRRSFVENIKFLISINDEEAWHNIKIYRSKHGTLSLIDVTYLGKGPRQKKGTPHINKCYGEDGNG